MATQVYYWSGEAQWAKVYDEGDKEYQNWQIEVALDKESRRLFDESGSRLEFRKSDDGKEYIKIRRPWEKKIGDKLRKFDPPPVLDKDGNPTDVLIGNGSLVTVKVEVYDTKKGKGTRLEAIRIDKLVPYAGNNEEREVLPPVHGEAF